MLYVAWAGFRNVVTVSTRPWFALTLVVSTPVLRSWPLGCKTFFMLNSAEHEIYPAQKC